jgi:predicted transcriptional regulator
MATILEDTRTEEGYGAARATLEGTAPKKMKYRSRFEIAATILEVAQAGDSTKTRLMYGSFLSFAQINEYLSFLLGNALITKSDDTHTYALTEKGMRFLRIYEELSQLVPLDEPAPAVGKPGTEIQKSVWKAGG